MRVANTSEGHNLGDMAFFKGETANGVVIIGGKVGCALSKISFSKIGLAPFSKDSTGRVELYNKDTESWYNLTSYHELIGLTAFTGLKSLVDFCKF